MALVLRECRGKSKGLLATLAQLGSLGHGWNFEQMGRGGVELDAIGGDLGQLRVRLRGGIRVGLNGGRLEFGG